MRDLGGYGVALCVVSALWVWVDGLISIFMLPSGASVEVGVHASVVSAWIVSVLIRGRQFGASRLSYHLPVKFKR